MNSTTPAFGIYRVCELAPGMVARVGTDLRTVTAVRRPGRRPALAWTITYDTGRQELLHADDIVVARPGEEAQ